MPRRTILNEILRLDPERDHQRIVFLDTFCEFPWDTTRSIEFALYRTFAAPSISAILDNSGEFRHRPQKRYDDTDLIISEIMEYGYDSERGRAALRRMNRQHHRFPITNDDYLYVLSTFTFEPIRWINRFGWRPLVEQEKLAAFYFWSQVARRMNIKSVPGDYHEFERFNREYERQHFHYTEANRRVGSATRDLFLGWFLPEPIRQLGAPFIYAMLDDSLLRAFGFPRPPKALRSLVQSSLRARGRIIRLLPERRRPKLRTEIKHRTYPRGYQMEDLGAHPGD